MPKKSVPRSPGNFEVGKGRPPQSTRWKPGQSGNRNGRPKGAKSAALLAYAALKRKMTVTINGARRRMTVAEVAYRQIADKAVAGDQKALAFLLMLANNLNPSDAGATDGTISTEQDLAIIADYLGRQRPPNGES
jgi:hypothetical protein